MVKDKKFQHEELLQKLVVELKTVRGEIKEVAEGYILCKEGEIETLLDYLLKMPPGKLKAVATPWMRQTRSLKLKPAKGRIKDLKKIDSLLHDLLNAVIESDDTTLQPKVDKKAVKATANRLKESAGKQQSI